ncbi:glycosyltransferase family 4 protein [Parasegetibacter sp. NRK P23]|uniref:glycosyltransferase family 4 protein n=1 Tax=Parasegetibacter sp. NRK P23 TaxID=2942999 RepID=UPI0020431316|nr:glycosyltransferase family 4 protein [Parasegetibacter sp. NRK P23]MCM5527618.1 glycosyltransferase family 4 protein [Parasegetibacter sp. NRK P23]
MSTIALVANTSWSMYNFRRGLIRALRAQGHKVLVIAPQDNFSAALVAEGVEFVPLYIDNYGTSPLNEWRTFWTLVRIYRQYAPGLIFHYTIKPNIFGTLAASFCKIPSVAVITGLGHTFSKSWMTGLVVPLYRLAMKRSKGIWFLNEQDKAVFVQRKIGDPSRMMVLPGEGVDTNFFYASGKIPAHPISFLYAGRMLKDKGVEDFAAAAAIVKRKHPGVTFRMVGFIDQENPNSITVQKLLEWQQEKTVEYLGESTDIRPFIHAADCVVLPSYYGEGLSRVLMEASSMAKPIITTRNVGCEQLVDEGKNGFLCNTKDPADLALQMEKMVDKSPDELKSMGLRSRAMIKEKYEESGIINIYLDFIRKMLR